MPDLKLIQNPHTAVSTTVWSVDGEVIGTFYNENRIEVSYNELSPYLVKALVATEDKRFYDHSGIDCAFVPRVYPYRLDGTRCRGGKGTLTQQLAKNLFHQDFGKTGKLSRLKQVERMDFGGKN